MSTIRRANGSVSGRVWATAALLAAVALCGCSKLQVKLGMRVEIAKLPVASMDAHLQ